MTLGRKGSRTSFVSASVCMLERCASESLSLRAVGTTRFDTTIIHARTSYSPIFDPCTQAELLSNRKEHVTCLLKGAQVRSSIALMRRGAATRLHSRGPGAWTRGWQPRPINRGHLRPDQLWSASDSEAQRQPEKKDSQKLSSYPKPASRGFDHPICFLDPSQASWCLADSRGLGSEAMPRCQTNVLLLFAVLAFLHTGRSGSVNLLTSALCTGPAQTGAAWALWAALRGGASEEREAPGEPWGLQLGHCPRGAAETQICRPRQAKGRSTRGRSGSERERRTVWKTEDLDRRLFIGNLPTGTTRQALSPVQRGQCALLDALCGCRKG